MWHIPDHIGIASTWRDKTVPPGSQLYKLWSIFTLKIKKVEVKDVYFMYKHQTYC